jgi:hypothetical protein
MPTADDRRKGTGPGVANRSTDDASGNSQGVRFGSPSAEARVRALLNKTETLHVHLSPADEQDVEGHLWAAGDTTAVLARVSLDDDDVEGHAISIHFPDADRARRFRNELLAAGVLTATVAMGVGTGIALAPSHHADTAAPAAAVTMTDTSAQQREGTITISIKGRVTDARVGGALAGTLNSADTSAKEREGGIAGSSAATSTNTSTKEREGGTIAAGQGQSADPQTQAREGGAPQSENEDPTPLSGFNP